MGFLWEGSNESTTTKQKLPPHVTEAGKATIGLAKGIADQPHTPYQGPRVAGLSANQKRAESRARRGAGTASGMVRSGFKQARQAGNTRWDADQADRFMNPFVERALDPVIRRINEEAQQNAIGTRAGMIGQGGVGAFGDARTAVLEGELEESRLRGVGDTLATGYAQAYDQGHRAFEAEQDRRMRSADLMGTQGGRFAATHSAGIADLMGTGGMRQAQDQRGLDTAYRDFLEQRDWDHRGLDAYIRALTGTPTAMTQTTSGNTGSSPFQDAVGLGVAAYGLYNSKLFKDFFS